MGIFENVLNQLEGRERSRKLSQDAGAWRTFRQMMQVELLDDTAIGEKSVDQLRKSIPKDWRINASEPSPCDFQEGCDRNQIRASH